jgi:hypothetical protein
VNAQTPDLLSIQARLDAIEAANERLRRQNRLLMWSCGAGACLAVLSVAAWLALPRPASHGAGDGAKARVIEAEEFVLKDPEGNVQGTLSSSADGPVLLLRGAGKGATPRVGICVGKGGPMVSLYDERFRERLRLNVNDAGAGLLVIGQDGKPRAGLVMAPTGTALELIGEGGKRRVEMSVGADSERLVFTRDGTPRAGVMVSGEGAMLDLFDANGRALFTKP